jgi:hypothetical protein
MSLDADEPNNMIADAIDAAEEIRDPLDGWRKKPGPIRAHPSCRMRWRRFAL